MKHNFTLIELLATIGIIVILAGILVPVVIGAVKKGEAAKAKAEITTLVNAIKQFENTYSKLPVPLYDDTTNYSVTGTVVQSVNANLIQALQGDDTIKNAADKKVNPRQVRFLDIRNTGAGDYLDPWGRAYRIIMSRDEEISLTALGAAGKYADGTIHQSVVVWSAGPDGVWDNKDDVHSFEAEYEAGKWQLAN